MPLGSMRELSMEELSVERESAARASPRAGVGRGVSRLVARTVHTHPEGVYVGKNYGIYLVRLACVLSLG